MVLVMERESRAAARKRLGRPCKRQVSSYQAPTNDSDALLLKQLGMKQLAGVGRVTIKKSKNVR